MRRPSKPRTLVIVDGETVDIDAPIPYRLTAAALEDRPRPVGDPGDEEPFHGWPLAIHELELPTRGRR